MIKLLSRNKGLWLLTGAIVFLSFALSTILYDRLPDPVPTHWGLSGRANGFMPKPWGAYVLPLAMTSVVLILALVPALSPKGFRINVESSAYRWTVASVAFLVFAVQTLALGAALGTLAMDPARPVLLCGIFLMVLGNFLPVVRRNFYIGIRTPWTLADEEVWVRTHRWGGRVFVAGGVVTVMLSALGAPAPVAIAAFIAACVAPYLYSFLSYRSLHPRR